MADSSGQWKESISLEETNKIRVSLGLKPIPDPATAASASASLDGDALAEANFAKRQESDRKAKEQQSLKERIDRARNQKERARRLVGRGLGDADDDEDKVKKEEGEPESADTKAWVKRQKKRAKELAEKRAREQEEADRLAEEEERERATKYGTDDLKGIKVAHGAEAFEEGEEHVLTLKDSRILDDEDDELHNLNLSENAKHAAALALKKKGRQAGQYTGFDDDEFVEGGGAKRGVLSKYDEGFEGPKEEGFRLGAAVAQKSGKGKAREGEEGMGDEGGEREKVKLSMDYTKTFNTDYLQEGDVGFKKPKKKKKRPARTTTLTADDDSLAAPSGSAMDVDVPAPARIERQALDDTNLIDDDDLQVSLARQRREAAKQKIKQLKQRAAAAATAPGAEMDVDGAVKKEEGASDDEGDDGDVLVMDDTSEFVRNISLAAMEAASRPVGPRTNGAASVVPKREEGAESVLPRIKAEEEDVPLSEIGAGGWNAVPKDEQEREEQDALMRNLDAPEREGDEVEVEVDEEGEVKPRVKPEDDDAFGGGEEKLVSRGLASTLSILRHQGLIKTRTPEELQRDRELKEREAWLAAQRRRAEDREREKIESRMAGDAKDQRQREYENKLREQRDAQATLEAYRNYKPVVELKYHDEFGRDMTPKEAWKHLSHSFHGHGSGSKKTEKRLKKIENERKAASMAAGDTPLSSAAAFAARAEKTGSATMILGVGNNNSAPHQDDPLANLSKSTSASGTGKGKGKGKAVASRTDRTQSPAAGVISDIPMRALPLPSTSASSRDASGTPEPRKAGFAPVRSFSPAVVTGEGGGGGGSGGGAATSASASEGPKLAIPISVKRKANGEGEGSPASKRRG
ncbi:hypothetical protein JCM1840_006689 [Sporobolomyces johnsonii]